jgi:hypothetical protein
MLSQWINDNNGLAEQNGFRKGRSTVDQIASLTNIIYIRKKNFVNLHFVRLSILKRRMIYN